MKRLEGKHPQASGFSTPRATYPEGYLPRRVFRDEPWYIRRKKVYAEYSFASLTFFSSLRVVSTQDCKGSWLSSLASPLHRWFTRLVERVDFCLLVKLIDRYYSGFNRDLCRKSRVFRLTMLFFLNPNKKLRSWSRTTYNSMKRHYNVDFLT